MYAKNVSAEDLTALAKEFDFEAHVQPKSNRVMFTLKNNSDQYHVVTDHGTYKSKVCFHGHWVFLEELFQRFPDAIVDASYYMKVRYDADNFEELAEQVGDTVVRRFDQLRLRDRCNCE